MRIEPAVSVHHPDPMARFTEPPPLKGDATEVEKMRHLLLTMAGALCETQMHGGAGVWHHQGDTGIPAILPAGIGERRRRV